MLYASSTNCVVHLDDQLIERFGVMAVGEHTLQYRGRVLAPDRTLAACGIGKDSSVMYVRKTRAGMEQVVTYLARGYAAFHERVDVLAFDKNHVAPLFEVVTSQTSLQLKLGEGCRRMSVTDFIRHQEAKAMHEAAVTMVDFSRGKVVRSR